MIDVIRQLTEINFINSLFTIFLFLILTYFLFYLILNWLKL